MYASGQRGVTVVWIPACFHRVSHADLAVRLQPRSKREAIVGERDGVPQGRVSVVRGERSREKVVRVQGMSLAQLRSALGLAPS